MICEDFVDDKDCDYCEQEQEFIDDEGFVFVEERYQNKLTKYFKSLKG